MTAGVGEPRTYGNWRRPTSPGLPRLGTAGTAAALGGLVVTMLVQVSAGLLPAALFALVVSAGIAPLAYRNRADRNGWQIAVGNVAWAAGRRRRQNLYLAGLAGPELFGSSRLPGLLASTTVLTAQNSYGEEFGLISIPSTRHYAVVLRCDPEGSQLVDPETIDAWVSEHGAWLAALAHEPGLEAVSVTVETAPDPGTKLATEVDTLLADGAPALSRQVLTETVATYPTGSAAVSARVTLVFTAARVVREEREVFSRRGKPAKGAAAPASRLRSAEDMAAQIGHRLPGLVHQLRATGAGTARAMTPVELAEMVRVAYDPQAAGLVEQARANGEDPGIGWDNAGPMGQVEAFNALRHDSAASITWQMTGPPKSAVRSRVLERLLAPNEKVDRKRVTLIYRPHDPGSAPDIAHADVRTAIGAAGARRGAVRAADNRAVHATDKTSQEVADGAGLVRFALLVTATVTDPDRLPAAAEVVSQLGSACQIQLRRCYGAQSAAFAAALGVGVVLPKHTRVPDPVRDYA